MPLSRGFEMLGIVMVLISLGFVKAPSLGFAKLLSRVIVFTCGT